MSHRELVEFYISSKLCERSYPSSLLRPEARGGGAGGDPASNGSLGGTGQPEKSPGPPGRIEAVKSALRDAAAEFELLFRQSFNDPSSQLDITRDTAYQSFKSVLDELFKDGVNWGRIVGLFAFVGVLSVSCVERNMSDLVPRLADWMTLYLDEQIDPWIQSQGGWDCFVEIYGGDAAAEARRFQQTLRNWLLAGAALLTGGLLAALVARKR
ncbi:bcl-2-like protein 1 [Cololabis saira]|uniref:bcl-2-like protein 1 n=1 Tax=Cololabis saira TaxID=129043 RepID=UPI002AD3B300|nr:bcl-2-like protein 1 [Cololabis saira]XP_061584734.1 bcl-2-like protein 1 [Cololabis saira]XP_061584736.1 bcl-2-like protein 1 [Cololabis saira]XP_061584737.1 bcl-2-like protein 1 [Cololabis saira]